MKPRAQLDEWTDHGTYLTGNVKGHRYLADGTHVRTSPLVTLDRKNRVAESESTVFELGSELTKTKQQRESAQP